MGKFVVVIPTCGGSILLERTLQSLCETGLPPNLLEVIIVENGVKYQVETLVSLKFKKLPIKYLYSETPNKSMALNLALQDLDDDLLIVFLDDDVRVCSSLLAVYSDVANTFSRDFFFGGPMGVDYEEDPPTFLKEILPSSARGFDLGLEECEISAPLFMGCNWAAFAKDLKLIGGFDSRFGPGLTTAGTGQETTAMQKLLDAGVKAVYLPKAKNWHYVPRDRCNEQWLKKRAFKMGFSEGYRCYKPLNSFLPYPKWLLRRRVELFIGAIFFKTFSNHKKSFYCFFKHQYFVGQISGYKKARLDNEK